MNSSQRRSRRSLYWHFLNRLPQNLMSRAAGWLAARNLPPRLMQWVIKRFASHFKINLEEVAEPLSSFASLQDFFVRKLKAESHTVDSAREAFVSPCDGAYGQSGNVENGLLLQVKGKSFRLSELLSDEKWALTFEGGTYAVLYLSPRDYHRFHAPCDLHIEQAAHVPGRLWPVNTWAVEHVDEVFCVNERVVMRASHQGGSEFAIVAVGATMVGKVRLSFDDSMTTNLKKSSYKKCVYIGSQALLEKGQELGYFEFGSTLVVVLPKSVGSLDSHPAGTAIRMGQRIGSLNEF